MCLQLHSVLQCSIKDNLLRMGTSKCLIPRTKKYLENLDEVILISKFKNNILKPFLFVFFKVKKRLKKNENVIKWS